MNTYIIDTYDHNGRHMQYEGTCLCNDDLSTVYIDYEKEELVCEHCRATRKLLTYWQLLSEEQNIESWMLKTGF